MVEDMTFTLNTTFKVGDIVGLNHDPLRSWKILVTNFNDSVYLEGATPEENIWVDSSKCHLVLHPEVSIGLTGSVECRLTDLTNRLSRLEHDHYGGL